MSSLNFDPRPYCERLAEACPDRFRAFHRLGGYYLRQKGERPFTEPSALQSDLLLDAIPKGWVPYSRHPSEAAFWAFFGPLADERKIEDIRPWDMVTKQSDHRFPTLLEEIIAAVVESFEVSK